MTLSTLQTIHEDRTVRKELRGTGELHIYTKISDLRASDFRGLTQIRSLTIGPEIFEIHRHEDSEKQSQMVLPSGLFSELKGLQELNIFMKGITHIEADAFSGLSSLRSLNLSQNKIASLDAGAFRGLGEVTNLNLSHNSLREIGSGFLSYLPSLLTLSFDYNKIQTIAEDAFKNVSKLIYLRLAGNRIMKIEPPTFCGLNRLSSLHLEGNPIKSIARALAELDGWTQVTLKVQNKVVSCPLHELRLTP